MPHEGNSIGVRLRKDIWKALCKEGPVKWKQPALPSKFQTLF